MYPKACPLKPSKSFLKFTLPDFPFSVCMIIMKFDE